MNINVSKVKIIVTVPVENADELRMVICDAGAGHIGNYSHCTMSEKVIGRFKGNEDSNPYIGVKNILEIVDEEKIEVQCDIEIVKDVIEKIREKHPYEEPLIEIVPLINEKDI